MGNDKKEEVNGENGWIGKMGYEKQKQGQRKIKDVNVVLQEQ